jgi:hypothetical protein
MRWDDIPTDEKVTSLLMYIPVGKIRRYHWFLSVREDFTASSSLGCNVVVCIFTKLR